MIIKQGEDDGHYWFCVNQATIDFSLRMFSPASVHITMHDSTQLWKGDYSFPIKGKEEIVKFLDSLQSWINDVRKDLANPYNPP